MKPLEKIPKELLNDFTAKGSIQLQYDYEDATSSQIQDSINEKFNLGELNTSIKRVLKHEYNYYGATDIFLYQALDNFPVFNKDVALIGSTYPWYEAVLLTRVPKSIDVIEYSQRRLDGIPNLRYIHPSDQIENAYDAIISISSYEHDGLGRYGDPLDPNGDIKAMENAKKMLKNGGLLYLAVPIGIDKVVFNKHRIYGQTRLPMLLKGWRVVSLFGFDERKMFDETTAGYQPIIVLKKE